jgi:imidazolonepropionase-like amidohydrolase
MLSFFAQAQKTLLHCGQLVDVNKLEVLKEQTIVVEGNKIVGVVSGYAKPGEGDKAIDLKKMTVMPGLIDMHIHVESETSPTRYLEGFTLNEADGAFKSLKYAEKNLMAGFTTVRDLGGSGVNIALRKAIQNGTVIGPRIYIRNPHKTFQQILKVRYLLNRQKNFLLLSLMHCPKAMHI